MGLISKIQDLIMPYQEEEEFEEEKEELNIEKKAKAAAVAQTAETETYEERQVVNGSPLYYSSATSAGSPSSGVRAASQSGRPQLTVHTTKIPELKVQIYAPTKFEQVTDVADDLLNKRAVIINYERADAALQRRLCDFIYGVCYVIDGEVKGVSQNILICVPAGVDVTEAMAALA